RTPRPGLPRCGAEVRRIKGVAGEVGALLPSQSAPSSPQRPLSRWREERGKAQSRGTRWAVTPGAFHITEVRDILLRRSIDGRPCSFSLLPATLPPSQICVGCAQPK